MTILIIYKHLILSIIKFIVNDASISIFIKCVSRRKASCHITRFPKTKSTWSKWPVKKGTKVLSEHENWYFGLDQQNYNKARFDTQINGQCKCKIGKVIWRRRIGLFLSELHRWLNTIYLSLLLSSIVISVSKSTSTFHSVQI